MKATFLLFISLLVTTMLQSQVSKTINITAGKLKMVLTSEELSTVTNLTLSGTIDARDFKTMRDDMRLLSVLDLSKVFIASYHGTEGTYGNSDRNYPASAIPAYAFYNVSTEQGKASLNSILLPKSLLLVESSAFYQCSGLQSVIIPPYVIYIKSSAFQDCKGLNSVSIPSSVAFIGANAFANSSGLISVDDKNQRYSSSNGVLFNKDKTKMIQCPGSISGDYSISSSVTIIGIGAFSGCEKLTSVVIPESIKSMGSRAFLNCKNLASITVNSSSPLDLTKAAEVFSGVDAISCKLNVPFLSKQLYKAANQWKGFINILEMPGIKISINKSIIINDKGGSNTIEINSNTVWTAFSNENWLTISPGSGIGLQTLTFNAGANTLMEPRIASLTIALEGGNSEIITVTQEEAPTIVKGTDLQNLPDAFLSSITNLKVTDTINARDFQFIRYSLPLLTRLDLSEATIAAYFDEFGTIGSSNTNYFANEIPPSAFYHYNWGYGLREKDSLKTVLLPTTLTSIGDGAFGNCNGLTSIIIPPKVTTIGNGAFSGCTGLTSINLPPGIATIGNWAFSGCTGLTSIILPESIDLGSEVFSGCSNLRAIIVNSSLPPYLFSTPNVFSGVDKTSCILKVPYGSRQYYTQCEQWSDFVNIVEMSFIELSVKEVKIATSQDSIVNINIRSDLTWNASSDQPWLILESNSGTGDQTLYFTIEDNTTTAPRTAKITFSASEVKSQTITVTQEGAPTALPDHAENSTLLKCYPNPFTNEITIEIQNPKHTEITVDIYDLAGERIKNLAIQRKDEKLDLTWNGTNDSGQKVAPEVYICKVNNLSKQMIYQGK